MDLHTKKVVIMSAVSIGIIMFAYMVPVYVVPVALRVSDAAGCMDYGCASSTFSECGGYSTTEAGSSGGLDTWMNGMEGMLCMMGLNTGGASINTSAVQITLNKA
jgi:hypothetical protein